MGHGTKLTLRFLIVFFTLTLSAVGQSVPVLQNPTTSQNVVQPSGTALTVNTLNAQYLNGTIQADQFPGTDMCVKIANAITSLIVAGGGDIDATHFSGVQACSEDPFSTAIPTNWGGNLSVRLGHVQIQSTQAWVIQNAKITLSGVSPAATQLVYTGTSTINAVLTANCYNGTSATSANMRIQNLYVVGNGSASHANLANIGFFALACFRSQFDDIWAWGTQNFGLYIQGGVDVELRAPRVSFYDANEVLGSTLSTNGAPQTAGIQLDSVTFGGQTYKTTAGTIRDSAVEKVPGTGIICASAANMAFLGGTSENNGKGVYVGPNCLDMTFIGMDVEANTSNVDFQDNGVNTAIVNLFAPNKILQGQSSTTTSGLCQGPACLLTGPSAPSGSCNTGSIYTRTDTGDLYLCKSSAWVLK